MTITYMKDMFTHQLIDEWKEVIKIGIRNIERLFF